MKLELPPCLIDKISTLKDNTIRIVLDFQELDPETMARIFTLKNQGELIQVQTDNSDEPKSKSERLRAVLYILWEQRGKKNDFNSFYNQQMERVIELIKDKLN